jgi:hypothetical protein
VAAAMSDAMPCPWCDQTFRPRQSGGHAQRFCRPSCRRAFHAAVRSWVLDAIADGVLTVAEIRNGAPATRALLPAAVSPAPVGEAPPQHPAPVVPRTVSTYAHQLVLELAMARAVAARRR